MRHLVFIVLCLCPFLASGGSSTDSSLKWEDRKLFGNTSNSQAITVLSSTDTSVFAPIIESFLSDNPELTIEYLVAGSAEVYQRFRQSPSSYDVVISSAMDLQLKLVNDGLAYQINDIQHPDWAQWRQSLFGFTLEPASIVVNKLAFATLPEARSRQAMIELLRTNPDSFRGKIGTYDVRQSGLGYLFATQDSRASETYWRLMEIMGSLETRLYCCSGEMIEDLANGEIVIAYNVLGSYANARTDIADKIDIILPSDFPNTMMRTVLVARKSQQHRSATSFLRYLTSAGWDDSDSDKPSLPSIKDDPVDTQQSIIQLEPGLMIFLDKLKRRTFIKEWESAIIQ